MSKSQKDKPSKKDLKKQISDTEKRLKRLEEQLNRFTSKCDKQLDEILIFKD